MSVAERNPAAPRALEPISLRSRRRERAARRTMPARAPARHALATANRVAALHRPADRSASPHGVPMPRRADAGSIHALAITARSPEELKGADEDSNPRSRPARGACPCAGSSRAKDAPRRRRSLRAKPAAKAAAVATVNGVAVPRSRMEFMMQQQAANGAPDNDQTRAMVRDDLVSGRSWRRKRSARGWRRPSRCRPSSTWRGRESWSTPTSATGCASTRSRTTTCRRNTTREGPDRRQGYKARHILVETEDQAKGMIAELKKGGKFDELATKNSEGQRHQGPRRRPRLERAGRVRPAVRRRHGEAREGKYTETPVQRATASMSSSSTTCGR